MVLEVLELRRWFISPRRIHWRHGVNFKEESCLEVWMIWGCTAIFAVQQILSPSHGPTSGSATGSLHVPLKTYTVALREFVDRSVGVRFEWHTGFRSETSRNCPIQLCRWNLHNVLSIRDFPQIVLLHWPAKKFLFLSFLLIIDNHCFLRV